VNLLTILIGVMGTIYKCHELPFSKLDLEASAEKKTLVLTIQGILSNRARNHEHERLKA